MYKSFFIINMIIFCSSLFAMDFLYNDNILIVENIPNESNLSKDSDDNKIKPNPSPNKDNNKELDSNSPSNQDNNEEPNPNPSSNNNCKNNDNSEQQCSNIINKIVKGIPTNSSTNNDCEKNNDESELQSLCSIIDRIKKSIIQIIIEGTSKNFIHENTYTFLGWFIMMLRIFLKIGILSIFSIYLLIQKQLKTF
ncbi:hypothetical protein QUF74_01610 [Candidatus Halobeggiatoa sp. HSG11]|nr:hypothetical protein [Candidatus Halobeggiatoa sp. HSG11]